jgi:hypothetical protein
VIELDSSGVLFISLSFTTLDASEVRKGAWGGSRPWGGGRGGRGSRARKKERGVPPLATERPVVPCLCNYFFGFCAGPVGTSEETPTLVSAERGASGS